MNSFTGVIGTGAVICYILAIIFDNAGLGALALGLTIYALH
jgi:hypothetical protein